MKRCSWAGPGLVGDPIDVVTGANVDRTRDFVLDGPIPIQWFRHYDSRWTEFDRSLGWGYRHSFDHVLCWDVDGIAHVHPAGYESYFRTLEYDGESHGSGGYTLERLDELTYQLSRHGEPTRLFHRPPGSYDAYLTVRGHPS